MYITRKNILTLVHWGFSREEVYFMPISEMLSYIQLLNEKDDNIPQSTENSNLENDINSIKMAGNTVSNFF